MWLISSPKTLTRNLTNLQPQHFCFKFLCLEVPLACADEAEADDPRIRKRIRLQVAPVTLLNLLLLNAQNGAMIRRQGLRRQGQV